MKVHKNGIIKSGFVLNEKLLRRVCDTLREQLTKVAFDSDIDEVYEVRYTSGAAEKFNKIGDVLELNNSGSGKICFLSITFDVKDRSSKVELIFADPTIDSKVNSICYSITGENRDWVFVTISSLEERIKPVERSTVWKIDFKVNDMVTFILMGCFIGLSLFFMKFIMVNESVIKSDFDKSVSDYIVKYKITDKIKELSNEKPDLKPVEVLYEYQLILENYERLQQDATKAYKKDYNDWLVKNYNFDESRSKQTMLFYVIGFGVSSALLIMLYNFFIKNLYPIYVFCWGDSEDAFNKSEKLRKFILVTVLLSLILSILAGIISDYLNL